VRSVILRAHFDGEHIQLDEPFQLRPETTLTVTVHADGPEDPEREDWFRFSRQRLEDAFGDDEPEYSPSLILVPNPDYEGG
jgi:hypothetical protein